jgi:hypothetical protein
MLAPDFGTFGKQFPAATCVFYMHDLLDTVYHNMGDKPVGPTEKLARHHIFVDQRITTFRFQYIINGNGWQLGSNS